MLLADLLAFLSAPSVLLQRSGRPMPAIAWLLGVFFVPYLGVLAWWMIGNTYLKKASQQRKSSTEEFFASLSPLYKTASFEQISKNHLSNKFPAFLAATTGNHAQIFLKRYEIFSAIERAIQNAKESIYMMFYIFSTDETGLKILNLLEEKAKNGVKVFLLVDGVGSYQLAKNWKNFREKATHVNFAIFHPVRFESWSFTYNFRNHRKLMIVDHKTAYLGGLNISNEYKYSWSDLIAKLEGSCVFELQEIFFDDWFFVTNQNLASKIIYEKTLKEADLCKSNTDCAILPSGPNTLSMDYQQNLSHDILFMLISSAKKSLLLTTPYFIPSQAIIAALRAAALRDVCVKILLPANNDVWIIGFASKAYYRLLLSAGVEIFCFLPHFIHRKSLIIDDEKCLLGSANVDSRSFKLNFELNFIIEEKEAVHILAEEFNSNLARSFSIKLPQLRKATKLSRLGESIMHLLSPLL